MRTYKSFFVYSYVCTNIGERYKKPFARFFVLASFRRRSHRSLPCKSITRGIQKIFLTRASDGFYFSVLVTENIKQFANYHFFQILKLHNMASPKTRRVLSELRTKDENDVSPQ